jgi:hypothetical protein
MSGITHRLCRSRRRRLCAGLAAFAPLRRGKYRFEEGAQVGGVAAESRLARQLDEQPVAGEQGAAAVAECGALGAVVAVHGARLGHAGEAFRRARAGAASAMHAAATVSHGGRAAGEARPGMRAAAGCGVRIAAGIAVPKGAWLTLHGVLATCFVFVSGPRGAMGGRRLGAEGSAWGWRGPGLVVGKYTYNYGARQG